MKFVFEFEIFGKTMKTEIEAPSEVEAREILLTKVRAQVKIKRVIPAEIERVAKDIEGFFKKLGIT